MIGHGSIVDTPPFLDRTEPCEAHGVAPPDVPLFELRDVVVTAGDVHPLDGVSLCLGASGVHVLLGESGSGKSTLLRLLNRLEVPSSGQVLFRGDDVAAVDTLDLRRRVGMVFQRPTLFPGTVRDNMLVADAGLDETAMVAALDRVGLDAGLLDRVADDLSGGEAQRACLARTLVTGPEVVLMDEVTSSLDRRASRGLEARARELADDGVPVVWVTHDLDQARRLDDQPIVLFAGRLASPGERRAFFAADSEPPDPDPGAADHEPEVSDDG